MNKLMPSSIRRLAAAGVFVFAVSTGIFASDMIQPYRLVDMHTAGVLPKAYFDVGFRVYASRGDYGSGLITGVNVGLTNRLNIGLVYGGEGIIGYSNHVRWNPLPGVSAKYRLFEEKIITPALTVGFDNQGYGGPAGKGEYGYDGYIYKSPGFFIAISKNYIMLNTVQIGFHGEADYSLEEAKEVTWPNAAGGIDIGINDELLLLAEYDLALNDVSGADNNKNYFRPHQGFLNVGIRWALTENFHIEFDMTDIFENKTRMVPAPTADNPGNKDRVPIGWGRELKVVYISKF